MLRNDVLVLALGALSVGFLAAVSGCSTTPRTPDPPPATQSQERRSAAADEVAPADTESTGARFDARLSEYEYPYDVRVLPIESQELSLEMAYMDVTPTSAPNGRVVVLLHGKNFSGAYWSNTIEALAAEGYRVVVPDQIGFGKSSKPAHFQYTFQALATHTATLLDALGVDGASIVGHSMGGMLATRFALMFPDRTERLVLVNPIGLEDWKLIVPYQTVEDWYARELQTTPEGVRSYMKESYFDGDWKPEYEQLAELQVGWAESPDRERVAWNAALTYDMIFTQPVLYEFGELEVPTALIIGDRDRTALGKNLVDAEVAKTMGQYGRLGREAADAIPGAKLFELEGVGHVPQYEAWPRYIEALQTFLSTD